MRKLYALETIVMRAGRSRQHRVGACRLQVREQSRLRWIDAYAFRQLTRAGALNDDLTCSAFFREDEVPRESRSSFHNDGVAVVRGIERRLQAVFRTDIDDAFAVLPGFRERAGV